MLPEPELAAAVGDGGSSETLTEVERTDTTTIWRHGAAYGPDDAISAPIRFDTTPARPDLTFDLNDPTPARADLTSDLNDPTPARPDLTFDLNDPTPARADLTADLNDLGGVSRTDRSPRCWEEPEGDHEEPAAGETPGPARSRLRQYLFGIPSDGSGLCSRLELACTWSERQADTAELYGEYVAPEAKPCDPEAEHSAPEVKLSTAAARDPAAVRGGGEGAAETWSVRGCAGGDVTVSDLVSQLEEVCLRRGGGDGQAVVSSGPGYTTGGGLPPPARPRKVSPSQSHR